MSHVVPLMPPAANWQVPDLTPEAQAKQNGLLQQAA
jgi:hypothetical protein